MRRFVTTRATWNIETGALLSREGFWYKGQWDSLTPGPSTAQIMAAITADEYIGEDILASNWWQTSFYRAGQIEDDFLLDPSLIPVETFVEEEYWIPGPIALAEPLITVW